MLISYCLMLFTDWIPDTAFQYSLGWSFIGLVAVLLAVNIKKVVAGALKDSWLRVRKSYAKYLRTRLKLVTRDKKPSLFAVGQALKEEDTTPAPEAT